MTSRDGSAPEGRLAAALDSIAAYGWTVSAIIDPEQHLDALRMVLDGMADLVVGIEPQDVPVLHLAADLSHRTRSGEFGPPERRTRMLPRAAAVPALDHPWREPISEGQRDLARQVEPLPDVESLPDGRTRVIRTERIPAESRRPRLIRRGDDASADEGRADERSARDARTRPIRRTG
ncbi:hypothetical protein KOI35_04980 [Actinoplanes bogorensis]|uniref:Uncharacterized protein n=1 Tax=Paractinoplanes bogorensis TaxID=1610840 RepID=A0ABS5YII2_9ACTN|nr:hypothetical protein [Actinoplanes bogorensis]MBU2662856.1 hypothetical protein [Actinoplanes bogorensis]